MLLAVFISFPVFAQDPPKCGNKTIEDCPCGKLPVCVISNHELGFYSQTFFRPQEFSKWEGFGQGESDYFKAMYLEAQMASALQQVMPCVEVTMMNSYTAVYDLITIEAEETGLAQKIKDAAASGDKAALEALQKQVDALFQKNGLGDLPWRNPDLAGQQIIQRMMGCTGGKVELKGSSGPDGFTISAETSSPIGGIDNQTSSSTADTPDGPIADLAKQAAGALAGAQKNLFCSCETVLERCVTTNWDLSNQEGECTKTRDCCGQITTEPAEKRKGLQMGETRRREIKCCSPLSRLRNGENVGDGAEEDRQTADQIWCPGTWNLRHADFDCDGIPNVKDDTPNPPEETK